MNENVDEKVDEKNLKIVHEMQTKMNQR